MGPLLESGPVRARRLRFPFTLAFIVCLLLIPLASSASAQEVQLTPEPSITPSTEITAWLRWMALGAMALTAVVVLGLAAGYMRFAPKFFGREESPKRLPPGARPPLLTRTQASRAPVGSTRPPVAQSPSATATAERATPAAAQPTSGPSAEPAVQADAVGEAEAREPEPRPTAKSPEDAAVEPEDQAAQAPTTAEVATATEGPEAQVPAAEATAPTAPAARPGTSELDQETFDRVLEEQLSKGVDKRVAEGRARAAAVVAARKKSQS